MAPKLVNVRLDEEHARKVRALQEQGVTLSELVRDAVDQRYAAVCEAPPSEDVAVALQRIFEQYPEPPGLPPRDYDVHDRKAAQRAIREHLKRRRS